MTCSTCHDVHRPQRNVTAFSATCLECHQVQRCGLFPQRGHTITGDCVECHMPALPTGQIVSTFEGRQVRPRVRSHWIRMYAGTAP